MFEDIEKEYKRNSKERKFNRLYWINAIISTIIISAFKNVKYIKYLNYVIVLLFIILFFIFDYKKTTKESTLKKNEKLIKKLKEYVNLVEMNHLNSLIILLKKYNFKTKNDLKLAIEYYNSKRKIKIESSFISWITSVLISLASIITIAYDTTAQKIDYTKISVIFGNSIGFIIVALIPILILKYIINRITFSKEKLHSELSEDLSYIYINFDKYKNQLTKK